jgi:hypothetical protein
MTRHIITARLTREQGEAYFAHQRKKGLRGGYLTYPGGSGAQLRREFNSKVAAEGLRKLLRSLGAKSQHKVLGKKTVRTILEEIVARGAAEFPVINPTVLLVESSQRIHDWIEAGNHKPGENKPASKKTIASADKLINGLQKRGILKEVPGEGLRLQPRNKKLRKIWEENKNLRQQNIILGSARNRAQEIQAVLKQCGAQYPDMFYRFYHHSCKVYWIQEKTKKMATLLGEIGLEAGITDLNRDFLDILKRGRGKTFKFSDNEAWSRKTRPLLEAFFHTREMLACLEIAAREVPQGTNCLPSGWAAVLYLYNLR